MQSLTEFEFLNEKIKSEKQALYSKGLILLPGLTAMAHGALMNNEHSFAVGIFTGAASTAALVYTKQKVKKIKHI